jgi:hypothetical protein
MKELAVHGRFWSGAAATVIEIDAPLLTVKLLM